MPPYNLRSSTAKDGRATFSVIKPYVRDAAELLDPQTLLRDIGCSFDRKKARYGTKGHKRKRTIGVPQSQAVWESKDLLFGLRYAYTGEYPSKLSGTREDLTHLVGPIKISKAEALT
jgi:hypothetical protein